MTIDSHIHFWRLARGDNTALSPDMKPIYRDREPEHLKPLLDAAGVDRIIVVQAAETLGENLYTLGLAAKCPWVAGVVGWVNPASASIREELDTLSQFPVFKGVRPVQDDNRSIRWMEDPLLEPGWRALARTGLALEILVQNPDELPVATALAARYPDITVVLDHCAKPDIAGGRFEPWATDLANSAENHNTSCKFSGLLNRAAVGASAEDIRRFAEHVFAAFGPERLIWGSDWPPLDLAASYADWIGISRELVGSICPQQQEDIFVRNAERIYKLSESQPSVH